MKFSIQLSADYPDKSYGGDRVYADMIEQAILADRLGFDAVNITEHHLMNCPSSEFSGELGPFCNGGSGSVSV